MAPIRGAVELGEVEAFCGSWDTVKLIKPDWFREGYVNVLVQLAMEGHPELRNVPLALQYAKTDKQRRFLEIVLSRQIMANPYAAPPGVPPDRLAALRQAFMRTLQDPEFLAMAEKMKLEINPVSGEVIQKLVERIFAPDPEVMKMLEVFKEKRAGDRRGKIAARSRDIGKEFGTQRGVLFSFRHGLHLW